MVRSEHSQVSSLSSAATTWPGERSWKRGPWSVSNTTCRSGADSARGDGARTGAASRGSVTGATSRR